VIGRRWLPPVLWAAFILVLTSIPGADIPSIGIEHVDKLVHFTMYGILGWLAARAFWRGRARRVAVIIGIAIAAFGAFDEWHQQFIPGRSMELLDWSADTLGAATGVTVAVIRRPRGPHT
jgi:VanZ family protein